MVCEAVKKIFQMANSASWWFKILWSNQLRVDKIQMVHLYQHCSHNCRQKIRCPVNDSVQKHVYERIRGPYKRCFRIRRKTERLAVGRIWYLRNIFKEHFILTFCWNFNITERNETQDMNQCIRIFSNLSSVEKIQGQIYFKTIVGYFFTTVVRFLTKVNNFQFDTV